MPSPRMLSQCGAESLALAAAICPRVTTLVTTTAINYNEANASSKVWEREASPEIKLNDIIPT